MLAAANDDASDSTVALGGENCIAQAEREIVVERIERGRQKDLSHTLAWSPRQVLCR
jgi:hypothetical protein